MKQFAPQNILRFEPYNSDHNDFGSNIQVGIKLPMSGQIHDLSRSYLNYTMRVPFTLTDVEFDSLSEAETAVAPNGCIAEFINELTAGNNFNAYTNATWNRIPILLNGANAFKYLSLKHNGETVFDDPDIVFNAKAWTLNKSQNYAMQHPHAFAFPTNASTLRASPLSLAGARLTDVTAAAKTVVASGTNSYFVTVSGYCNIDVNVPASALFLGFEEFVEWPSFMFNSPLEIMLTTAPIDEAFSVFSVANDKIQLSDVLSSFDSSAGSTVELSLTNKLFENDAKVAVDKMNFTFAKDNDVHITNVTLTVPAHDPTEQERVKIQNVMSSGIGMNYGFRHYLVSKQPTSAFTSAASTVHSTTTNAKNIGGVLVSFTDQNNSTVSSRPNLSAVSMSLGPNTNITPGGQITSIYNTPSATAFELFNHWAQAKQKHLATLHPSLVHDMYCVKPDTTTTSYYGNYHMYFTAAMGDELGCANSEFNSTIKMEYINPGNYNSSNAAEDNASIATEKTAINVGVNTFYLINISPNGLSVTNPYAYEVDAVSFYNTRGNGFRRLYGMNEQEASAAIMDSTVLIPGVGNTIDCSIDKLRKTKPSDYVNTIQTLNKIADDVDSSQFRESALRRRSARDLDRYTANVASSVAAAEQMRAINHGAEPEFPLYGALSKPAIGPNYVFSRFMVMSTPELKPGVWGGLNQHPLRLRSFAKEQVVPVSAEYGAPHGATNYWNGSKDFFKTMSRWIQNADKNPKIFLPENKMSPDSKGLNKIEYFINQYNETKNPMYLYTIAAISGSLRDRYSFDKFARMAKTINNTEHGATVPKTKMEEIERASNVSQSANRLRL